MVIRNITFVESELGSKWESDTRERESKWLCMSLVLTRFFACAFLIPYLRYAAGSGVFLQCDKLLEASFKQHHMRGSGTSQSKSSMSSDSDRKQQHQQAVLVCRDRSEYPDRLYARATSKDALDKVSILFRATSASGLACIMKWILDRCTRLPLHVARSKILVETYCVLLLNK